MRSLSPDLPVLVTETSVSKAVLLGAFSVQLKTQQLPPLSPLPDKGCHKQNASALRRRAGPAGHPMALPGALSEEPRGIK